MIIGVINKISNKTEYTYSYHRYKTFPEYPSGIYAQYEITDGTDERAYSWDGSSIVFDSEWVEPAENALIVENRIVNKKSEEGFALYLKIMADINSNNLMPAAFDTGLLPLYKNNLTTIRNMLKDGFPEMAIRELHLEIKPLGVFTTEKIDEYTNWIAGLALKYGCAQATIDAIITAPEGAI